MKDKQLNKLIKDFGDIIRIMKVNYTGKLLKIYESKRRIIFRWLKREILPNRTIVQFKMQFNYVPNTTTVCFKYKSNTQFQAECDLNRNLVDKEKRGTVKFVNVGRRKECYFNLPKVYSTFSTT